MLYFAEDGLIKSIGPFGIVGSVINSTFDVSTYKSIIETNNLIGVVGIIPGQCQAFLTSSREFVWFIEKWDVVSKAEDQTSFEVPLVSLQNKKVYPAKVVGLNLALLGLSDAPVSVIVRWREGLIRYGSLVESSTYVIPCLRPGFGQQIIDDLKRPLLSETVVTNHLGLTGATANSRPFWGPLGRLMSMAFHVDETLAAKYDSSQSKKKKKSLNSQDYEEIPTYPAYTPYQDTSGY
ncbi:MAG: hypothetical protein EAZ18_00235 [Oscillatoriales cyanobacterium]|nr:MAG: hypothetical protein EAZ18_00235 [Oscillatoriales cyanobacterium]